jgi:hypothetical protein
MGFIEVNADVKLLTAMLERIARVLERILLEAYQIKMGHCAEPLADPDPKNPPTVDYATDEDLAREHLTEVIQVLRHGRTREESDVEQDHDPDRMRDV